MLANTQEGIANPWMLNEVPTCSSTWEQMHLAGSAGFLVVLGDKSSLWKKRNKDQNEHFNLGKYSEV